MFECPPYLSSKLHYFAGLQAEACLLHSGKVFSKSLASRSYGKLGPIGHQEDLGLGERTPDKFFTHLSAYGIIAGDPELPSCALLFFGWPPFLFEWPSFCMLAQSAKFISSPVQDLSMPGFCHSLDEITAFNV